MSDPIGADRLAAAMLEQRRVMVSGTIDPEIVAATVSQLMYLDGLSPEPVSVVINAEGATIDAALALIDTIGLMRAAVTVDVLGRAEGAAGLVVASAPGRRRIGATASISLHLTEPTGRGTAAEIAQVADHHRATVDRIAGLIAERSGQDQLWVVEQMRAGRWFDAAGAVDHGLVDEVR